ncbi:hypothetical protein GCM10010255_24100 [Streptomyces coeruleofuscus]|uniref:Uncharacterized protein n=1 Tax=Streptomyces coeruleofuscus TaxID=66879 RepID=A0ABP5V6Y8_9ACTN
MGDFVASAGAAGTTTAKAHSGWPRLSDIEFPGDDPLPSGAPLTSNSADSMTVSPSTTADTER